MQGSPQHFWLGLKILSALVGEFNQPTPGRTLTVHRKVCPCCRGSMLLTEMAVPEQACAVQVAVSFRDPYLFQTFELALLANKQLLSDSTPKRHLQEQVRHRLKYLLIYSF